MFLDLANSTHYDSRQNETFSRLLLFPVCPVEVIPSAPSTQTPPLHILSEMKDRSLTYNVTDECPQLLVICEGLQSGQKCVEQHLNLMSCRASETEVRCNKEMTNNFPQQT